MSNNGIITELKAILTVCGKVSFADTDNAKNVSIYMSKNGFNSSMSMKFMDRMKELSDPNTNAIPHKCICCSSATADVNKVFCKSCYAVLSKKIASQPHSSALNSSDKNVDSVPTSYASSTVIDNTDGATASVGIGELEGDTETKTSSRKITLDRESDAHEEYWNPDKSIVYHLSSAISPILWEQANDVKVEIKKYNNHKIDSTGEITVSNTSAGKQKPKKRHIVRNILLGVAGFYAIIVVWYCIDTYIVHPQNSESNIQVDNQPDKDLSEETNTNIEANLDQGEPNINDSDHSTDYSQYDVETISPYDDGVADQLYDDSINQHDETAYGYHEENEQAQESYFGVDFSRYYVSEKQLLTSYKELADSVLQYNDGSAMQISFANREYNEKLDWIIYDIYESRNSYSLGQICLRNDETGYLKGVWILSYDYTLPRVLYEIIRPDLDEEEMNDFIVQTARDDGKMYFYLDGAMYYCISYISQDNLYITVVTRDEEYVREHTGGSVI